MATPNFTIPMMTVVLIGIASRFLTSVKRESKSTSNKPPNAKMKGTVNSARVAAMVVLCSLGISNRSEVKNSTEGLEEAA